MPPERWEFDGKVPTLPKTTKALSEAIEYVSAKRWPLLAFLASLWGILLLMAFTLLLIVRLALTLPL